MDDAHDAGETEETHYLRLPWPLVAFGLLGLVAIALAIGLLANRYLRPQIGLVATPAAASVAPAAVPTTTAAPTAPPTAIAAAAPTTPAPAAAPTTAVAAAAPTAVLAPATPLPAQATPIPSTPTGLALDVLTATPTSLPVVATSTPPSEASPTASALPTVEPALADEVGKAYVTFWRVRSQALLELDPNHLPDVMDGDYLQSFELHLADLREQGRAIKSQVTLNYKVVQATNEDAVLIDTIEDDSFYVATGTDQPLTDPANDLLRLQVKLRRIEGIWKVVESVSID